MFQYLPSLRLPATLVMSQHVTDLSGKETMCRVTGESRRSDPNLSKLPGVAS